MDWSVCMMNRNKGVHPVADIVINHRCGDIKDESCGDGWVTFSRPSWGPVQVVENDWTGKGSEVTVPDWCHPGNPETTDNFYGAPDVDHSQEKVQTDVKNWLNWLQTHIGFVEGWRFDMVKGSWAATAPNISKALGGIATPGLVWVSITILTNKM
eukprot:Nk52_evm32s2462 gene=Nk52_evmTU32s2462